MKESFEDKITKRIRDVLEHHEPEYTPQAWEEFRKMMPAPRFSFRKIFLRYRYWFAGLTISGALIVILRFISPGVPEKDMNFAGGNSILASNPESERIIVADSSERTVNETRSGQLSPSVPENDVNFSIKNAAHSDDSMETAFEKSWQLQNPGDIISDIPAERSFGSDYSKLNVSVNAVQKRQLIPEKFQPGKIWIDKSPSVEKPGKLKLQLPSFHALTVDSKAYDRFVGPNRFALFYSGELHHDDSLKSIGFSHGAGISFEGRLNSSVLVSIGISYQSMIYNKTISSVKVPVRNEQPPSDTTAVPQYIDSLEIRSGHYSFLELPVSVSLKLIENQKSQLWIGTGISAVAFLQQHYSYGTVVGGVSSSSEISVSSWENIYPLGSLNFSLFYRYSLSDRLSLHSSVQYKQHLTRMGYNAMKLDRLNLQIGLIYRFGRTR